MQTQNYRSRILLPLDQSCVLGAACSILNRAPFFPATTMINLISCSHTPHEIVHPLDFSVQHSDDASTLFASSIVWIGRWQGTYFSSISLSLIKLYRTVAIRVCSYTAFPPAHPVIGSRSARSFPYSKCVSCVLWIGIIIGDYPAMTAMILSYAPLLPYISRIKHSSIPSRPSKRLSISMNENSCGDTSHGVCIMSLDDAFRTMPLSWCLLRFWHSLRESMLIYELH